MNAVSTDFGIKEALQQLGVKDINNGTSTGSNSFGSGEAISSYSPTDGSLIGKVSTTTKADYEKVMESATAAFTSLDISNVLPIDCRAISKPTAS